MLLGDSVAFSFISPEVAGFDDVESLLVVVTLVGWTVFEIVVGFFTSCFN